jgi:diguanylate cyclase (GGDEF)-like protein/PAS domain S-box-containing protein
MARRTNSDGDANRSLAARDEILRLEEEIFLLETLMDNVPDSIYFKDRESRFTRINRYAAERFGIADPVLAVGRTDFDIFAEEHAAKALRDEQEILRTGRPLVGLEEKEIKPDGGVRWVSTTKLPLRARDGAIVGTFGISRDITQRKLAEAQLERQAFFDALTGLPNRALFMNRLQHLFHRARRTPGGLLFAVLYFDLDRFKSVNDGLGHLAGDELLVGLARRLEQHMRPSDTFARLGGDEFTILLEDISSEADATRVADRIKQELETPFVLAGHELYTSASIGIALSLSGYNRPEDMLRDADTAMYRAKAAGRSRHQIFDADMHERAMALLRLETDLRHAIERGELLAYYQPIIDLTNRTLLGFEALARWRHPERGLVPPDVFIPVAEETGLVGVIGELMLKEACQQMKTWQDRYPRTPPLGISVNISTRQLGHAGLVDQVARILDETGLASGSLTLELTESTLMQSLKAGAGVIRQLHDMAVHVHIDDFGSGYSSLAYLQNLPVDTLKVDRSFVSAMDGTPQQTALVRAIVALARNLGMNVIAEGIETDEQADTLLTLRCQTGQGFLFSRPLPAAEAERLIVEGLPPGPGPHGGPGSRT